MKTRISFRMDEADYDRIRSDAREAGMSVSDYIRAALTRRPQNNIADAQIAAQLMRIETLALAAAVSAYESQIVARAGLTSEQAAKLKDHRVATIAAWRAWGVKAAFLGLDMRPKSHKEHTDE
jgi:Arc/MetJ-type ribon-helix-helix transcriptional regulator